MFELAKTVRTLEGAAIVLGAIATHRNKILAPEELSRFRFREFRLLLIICRSDDHSSHLMYLFPIRLSLLTYRPQPLNP
jgi:hypothetical protein